MQSPGEYVLSRRRGCSTQSVPVHSIVELHYKIICHAVHVSDATAGERKKDLDLTGSK